jgi:methanogenic corrinoid protein MtbC1
VESALASGSDPAEIYTRLLGPALRSVGERWANGDLTVAEEHLASSVALRVIGRLGPRFARPGRPRGRVIVATPPGERHAIPGAMLADLLRGAGFAVIDLGADIPADELEGAIGAFDDLVAVCIAATTGDTDRAIKRSVKAVQKVVDVPVVLGGAGVADAEHAAGLGADHYAGSMPDAVVLVTSLSE